MAGSRISAITARKQEALDPNTQAAGLGFVLGAFIGVTVFMFTYIAVKWAIKRRQRQDDTTLVVVVDDGIELAAVRTDAN
ncbi:hypothetical protein N0V84_005853 [Fusarium piperis]|uniref:Uncharacterized protein n=1 Tax=Fusarium piperis TaxID=1435070 RepID=A0A9W8WCY8_9HYPO|nr:hypothetical protein N0V84_005853 [Fusarium piperis]